MSISAKASGVMRCYTSAKPARHTALKCSLVCFGVKGDFKNIETYDDVVGKSNDAVQDNCENYQSDQK